MVNKYYYAKGRRKKSVATVRLYEGNENSLINNKKVEEVYASIVDLERIYRPIVLLEKKGQFYFTAKVKGGGKVGQRDAITHALARSLAEMNADFRKVLKKAGLLTRDERKKERKKTGLLKARKAPQYSKR